MKDKNAIISAGFAGLLKQPEPTANQEPATTREDEPKTGNYKTVCYSIPPALADNIRYIARFDRKKINAVVAEAFAAYCENWKPAPAEKPRKLTV